MATTTATTPTVPVPYDVCTKVGNTLHYGTPYPDQYIGHLQAAFLYNNIILTNLARDLKTKEKEKPTWLTDPFISKNMVEPFVQYGPTVLTAGTVGDGLRTANLFHTFAKQVLLFFWHLTRERSEKDPADDAYQRLRQTRLAPTLPNKSIRQLTMTECIETLSQMCYVIRHVAASADIDRVCSRALTRAATLLLGYGPPGLMDGAAQGFAYTNPQGKLAATNKYILHVGVRAAVIWRYQKWRQMPRRDATGAELALIAENDICRRLQTFIEKAIVDEKDVIDSEKVKLIHDGRFSLGDHLINKVENPGQALSANDDVILASVHPQQAAAIKARREELCKASQLDILRGAAGVDVADTLVVRLFFSHVTAIDTPKDIYNAIVIRGESLDTEAAAAKIMSRTVPLLVKRDARYGVCEEGRFIECGNGGDVYMVCALWLVRLFLKCHGAPEQMNSLDNTYREFCSSLRVPERSFTVQH